LFKFLYEKILEKVPKILKNLTVLFVFLLLLPLILLYWIWNLIYGLCLRLLFYQKWIRKGKNIIFVYSDSPHWKTYVEDNILPKLESQYITLKWSKRSHYRNNSLESRIFYHWGGYNDYNPMAIIFISFFNIKTVRFYKAFKDYKHGKDKLLNEKIQELFDIVSTKTT